MPECEYCGQKMSEIEYEWSDGVCDDCMREEDFD